MDPPLPVGFDPAPRPPSPPPPPLLDQKGAAPVVRVFPGGGRGLNPIGRGGSTSSPHTIELKTSEFPRPEGVKAARGILKHLILVLVHILISLFLILFWGWYTRRGGCEYSDRLHYA